MEPRSLISRNSDGSLSEPEPDPLIHPAWVRIYRAIDSGFYPDPTVCLWFAVMGKQVIVFKERVWYRTIAKQVAKDIRAESVGMQVITTYADPTIGMRSGHGASEDIQSLKDIYEREGVPIELATNDRALYAHAINSALMEEIDPWTPRLRIYEPGCPYLARYLPKMQVDEKNPSALADHKHDHPIVTMAYFLMNYMPDTAPPLVHRTYKWMRPKSGARQVIGRNNVR